MMGFRYETSPAPGKHFQPSSSPCKAPLGTITHAAFYRSRSVCKTRDLKCAAAHLASKGHSNGRRTRQGAPDGHNFAWHYRKDDIIRRSNFSWVLPERRYFD